MPPHLVRYLIVRELAVGSACKWIEEPRRVLNERSRTYETDLSWLTISTNQASNSDRWSQ